MKKIFILVFSLLSLSFYTFADTGKVVSGEMKMVDAKIDGSKFAEASADLSNIDISFCDNSDKQITIEALPNEQVPFCLQASNNGDKPTDIVVKFVDGVFTNDQWKNRACQTDDKISSFGQYVTGYETKISLDAHSLSKQTATFQYPINQTGTVYGCLIYYVKNISGATTGSVNFDIQIRKAKFIDMNIVDKKKSDQTSNTTETTDQANTVYLYIIFGVLIAIGVAIKLILKSKKKETPIT